MRALALALIVSGCTSFAAIETEVVERCKSSERYDSSLHTTAASQKAAMRSTYSCIRQAFASNRTVASHPNYDLISLYYAYAEAMDMKIADGEIDDAEGLRQLQIVTARLEAQANQRRQLAEIERLARMQSMLAGFAVLSTIQPPQPIYQPGPLIRCSPNLYGNYDSGFTCY